MQLNKLIFKNISKLFTGSLFSAVLNFLITALIFNTLPLQEIGVYASYLACSSICVAIATFRLEGTILKKPTPNITTYLTICTGVLCLNTAILSIILIFFSSFHYLITLIILLESALLILRKLSNYLEKYNLLAILPTLQSLLFLSIISIFMKYDIIVFNILVYSSLLNCLTI